MKNPVPSAYRRTAGAALALVSVLAVAQLVGMSGRAYAPEQRVYEVTSAAEAYEVLKAEGVSGRVLVLLDERTQIVPRVWMATFMESLDDSRIDSPVMTHNVASSLIYAGIVREVYFVPPEAAWLAEFERAASRPDSLAEGDGVRLRFYGIPIHVTRPMDLPYIRERAIVYISGTAASGYDASFLAEVTDPRVADVVVRVTE